MKAQLLGTMLHLDLAAPSCSLQQKFSPSGYFSTLAFLPYHLLHCMSFLPIMHPVHYRSSNLGDGYLQARHHGHPVEQADGGGGHVLQGERKIRAFTTVYTHVDFMDKLGASFKPKILWINQG